MPPRLRILPTTDLTDDDLTAMRDLLDRAFGTDEDEAFTDEDWAHSLGGTHVLLDIDGTVVAHASIVERELSIDGRSVRTGYVEAVATDPDRQGRGYGTTVMTAVTDLVRDGFELGALGTGAQHFYERLGWRTWQGPSAVSAPEGMRPTPDDDGFIMVLETPASPPLDMTAAIVCDWRPGDVW